MELAVVNENDSEVQLRAAAAELCEAADEVVIMTRNDLSAATDLAKAIKTRARDIEDERTRIVRPFNEGVKAINARFKMMSEPLAAAESTLKGKMLAFQRQEDERARAEAARLEGIRLENERKAREEAERKRQEEAAQAADETLDRPDVPQRVEVPLPVSMPIQPVLRPTTYGQTGAVSTVKKVWTFELIDIKDLAAARPDLVTVNTVEVNREIRGKGGEIPGLRVYQKEELQVR